MVFVISRNTIWQSSKENCLAENRSIITGQRKSYLDSTQSNNHTLYTDGITHPNVLESNWKEYQRDNHQTLQLHFISNPINTCICYHIDFNIESSKWIVRIFHSTSNPMSEWHTICSSRTFEFLIGPSLSWFFRYHNLWRINRNNKTTLFFSSNTKSGGGLLSLTKSRKYRGRVA